MAGNFLFKQIRFPHPSIAFETKVWGNSQFDREEFKWSLT